MAIRKRTIVSKPVPEIVYEEEASDLSPQEIEALRLVDYCAGNEGTQPHPKDVPVATLLSKAQVVQNYNDPHFGKIEAFYRNRIRSPLTGIRAFCVICAGGAKAANSCDNTACPLWTCRTGRNAFFGKFKQTEEVADAE